MRNFDFAPLYRHTIGFDRLANMIDNILDVPENHASYPPFNIEKTAENAYRISIAVAGFTQEDLDIESKEAVLVVSGKQEESEEKREFLHRGIAARAFERRFQLADHVRVVAANLENGLLHIDLEREIPEALKARKIEIASPKKRINKN